MPRCTVGSGVIQLCPSYGRNACGLVTFRIASTRNTFPCSFRSLNSYFRIFDRRDTRDCCRDRRRNEWKLGNRAWICFINRLGYSIEGICCRINQEMSGNRYANLLIVWNILYFYLFVCFMNISFGIFDKEMNGN